MKEFYFLRNCELWDYLLFFSFRRALSFGLKSQVSNQLALKKTHTLQSCSETGQAIGAEWRHCLKTWLPTSASTLRGSHHLTGLAAPFAPSNHNYMQTSFGSGIVSSTIPPSHQHYILKNLKIMRGPPVVQGAASLQTGISFRRQFPACGTSHSAPCSCPLSAADIRGVNQQTKDGSIPLCNSAFQISKYTHT